MSRWAVVAVCVQLLLSCAPDPPRSLDDLLVQDSTYIDPDTGAPYSGRVVARYPERLGGGLRLEARLEDGTWEGELTIYHSTGRIHYQGEMAGGAQCGGWVENDNPTVPETILQEVTEELESLVIYPECPGA